MAAEKQHLTQAGYDRLIKELAELNEVKLPDVIKKLTEASEQWDISENAEYDDALARRDLLKARIAEIESLLENVEIIKKWTGKGNQVIGYGSTVELEFEDSKVEVIELVGSGEVSVEDGLKVSFQSPLGTAIRGKKVWDSVKIMMAGSRKLVKVKKIS